MPVRICHLRFSDVVGGVETHILALLGALDRDRYEASVLCFPNPPFEERLRAAGIPFQTVTRRGPRDLGFITRLRRVIRASGARLVHTHGVFSDLYAGLAGRLAWRRPRHVLTKHTFADADHSISPRKARAFDLLDRWVTYPRVDRIVAVSEERRRGLLTRQRVPDRQITVIHNGLPVSDALRPDRVAPALRRELGLAPETPLVGFLGRLNLEKGPDIFVEILAHLAQRCPAVHGAVVGDGPLRADLERLAHERGVGERIYWIAHRPRVEPLLADMDVVVMPSRTEGLPMLLLEAMALARPVVASDVGGMPEVIERGRSGWLCPVGDAGSFAAVIARALELPEARRIIGEQARARILAHFTAQAMAEKMMALYDEVLGIRR